MKKMIPVLLALAVLVIVPLAVTADEAAPAGEQIGREERAGPRHFAQSSSRPHEEPSVRPRLDDPIEQGQLLDETTDGGYEPGPLRTHLEHPAVDFA